MSNKFFSFTCPEYGLVLGSLMDDPDLLAFVTTDENGNLSEIPFEILDAEFEKVFYSSTDYIRFFTFSAEPDLHVFEPYDTEVLNRAIEEVRKCLVDAGWKELFKPV